MQDSDTKIVLGSAQYEARWIARTFMVRLVARGVMPCANYIAQLEKRPERVLPPMWNLVFYVPNFCLTALRPFEVEAIMINDVGARTITVFDATGEHAVPIQQSVEVRDAEPVEGDEAYVVHARLPRTGDHHHGCLVVPESVLVTAIHYRAFGPAAKDECDAFVLANCSSVTPDLRIKGPEVPWPLVQ